VTKRIIAVFGPTHRKQTKDHPEQPVAPATLACARQLGAIIAAGGHILLTGGKGPGERSVKDVAIAGACDHDGEWVGVLPGKSRNGGSASATADDVDLRRSHVLATGLGRKKRNFLEALMCDAAIALYSDGPGTRSEVACAFALQRPVAFVGEEWRQHYDLDSRDGAERAKDLLKAGVDYLQEADSVDPCFRSLIAKCLQPTRAAALLQAARHATERPYCYFDLLQGSAAAGVVKWAATVPRPEGVLRREVSASQGLETEWTSYIGWLEQLELGERDSN
jgi:predicted Rossmann-fold nucleotide-binding protein